MHCNLFKDLLYSHLRLGLPNGLFPVGLPIKILKALLPSFILAKWPAHFNILDLIPLTILGERTNYEVPQCGAFSTPHFHPSWVQKFTLGSFFQIPLACIPPLM